MGSTQAAGMAGAVADGDLSLSDALHWHLTVNHFPPLPTTLVPVALRAIELADAGEMETLVRLPRPITWRGEELAPVWAMVEGWHLEPFLS